MAANRVISELNHLISIGNCMYLHANCMNNSQVIDHLHARTKEFINTLIIAVTSRLDAVVTSMNVLNPMENQ